MRTSRKSLMDSLDDLMVQTESEMCTKLIQPTSFTKAKQRVLRKMNVDENQQLIVYKYEPTKSFFISKGFAKAPVPNHHRSSQQHQKILSKFLIDYLNRKTFKECSDRRRHSNSHGKQVIKDDRRIDPSFTYRVGKQFRRKVRSSLGNYEEDHKMTSHPTHLTHLVNPQKTFLI